MMENRFFFGEQEIRFVTDLELINVIDRTNNRDCSLRAHLFLSYHLIYKHHGPPCTVNRNS